MGCFFIVASLVVAKLPDIIQIASGQAGTDNKVSTIVSRLIDWKSYDKVDIMKYHNVITIVFPTINE